MNINELVIKTIGIDPQHESPLLFPGNRWNFLPWLFDAAGFKVGAEIGVGGGRFSKHLCETVRNLKLYSIDPWQCYDYYESRYSQAHFDRDYRKAKEVLAPYNCEIVRDYSFAVAPKVRDEALDFVFIDANEDFDNVTRDLRDWIPKVRRGGIISGTCYYNFRDHDICQVKDAVDTWTKVHNIDPWFVVVHQRYPTFFWVRE